MANNIQDWDFDAKHVNNNNRPGQFISGKTVLISLGPPLWEMTISGNTRGVSGNSVSRNDLVPNDSNLRITSGTSRYDPVPVGLVQDITAQQGRNIDKIYELGSDRPFLVPGKTVPNLSFSKVLYAGPSLLKFSAAYYLEGADPNKQDQLLGGKVDKAKLEDLGNIINGYELKIAGENKPGSDDFFINLASEIFTFPFGVMVYMKDNMGVPYGAFYAEECYISGHNFGINTGSTVIMEQAQIECARFRAIDVLGKNIASGVQS